MWSDNLAEPHRSIAADTANRVHVLAGPGTGKTWAMMRRIARLLEEGTAPDRILAISFTRTAALDIQEQLGRLGLVEASKVMASTLHSFCFRILSSEEAFTVLGRTPRPLFEYERNALVEDLSDEFEGKREVDKLLKAYEAAWARLQHEVPGSAPTPLDLRFGAAVQNWLVTHQCMLIGELVPLTLRFLRQNPTLPVIPALAHVLVDEYQDLNKADQVLIDLLAANCPLTVIGDDNQSIYRFRHANPEGIRTFSSSHGGTSSHVIRECKRCPPNVVEMSNALIAHDPDNTRGQPLDPDISRASADVQVVQHMHVADEAECVAKYIANYLTANPTLPHGQVMVLATRRLFGNAIKASLIQAGYKALSYFTEDLVETVEAAEGFCLLRLLVNRDDRPAIRAWLHLAGGSVATGAKYRALSVAAAGRTLTLRGFLDALADGSVTIPHGTAVTARWKLLVQRLGSLNGLDGLSLVRTLWPDPAVNSADVRLTAENLAIANPEPSDLLDALAEAISQPSIPNSDSDIIRVMSLHKSKGLTSKLVVIAGAVAEAIPGLEPKKPETHEAALAEQRRLFYVAMTRGTDKLLISGVAYHPSGDAVRHGLKVSTTVRAAGDLLAQLHMTPYLSEIGGLLSPPMTSGQWRQTLGLQQLP